MYGLPQLLQFFNQLLLSISSHQSYTATMKNLVKNLDQKTNQDTTYCTTTAIIPSTTSTGMQVTSLTRKPLIKFTFIMFHTGRSFVAGPIGSKKDDIVSTRVGTLIVATIYLQLIQNRYMFRSFTVLQCSHQHCVQPVASDVEVVGYL